MSCIQCIVIITLLLSILDVAVVVANSAVIAIVITINHLHTISHYLIASLAVADLFVGLFVLPIAIAVNHIGHWPFDLQLICHSWIAFTILTCHASITNLCCISIDRYIIIVHPKVTNLLHSPLMAVTMITLCWSLPILTVTSALIGPVGHVAHSSECRASLGLPFRVYTMVVCFVLPLVLLVFIYCRVVGVIKHRLTNFSPSYARQANPLYSTDKSSTWIQDSSRRATNTQNSVNRPKLVFLNPPTAAHFLGRKRAQKSQQHHKISGKLRHSTANKHHDVRLAGYSSITIITLKCCLGRDQRSSNYAKYLDKDNRLEVIGMPQNGINRWFDPQSESLTRSTRMGVSPLNVNGHNTPLSAPQKDKSVAPHPHLASFDKQVQKSSSMNFGEVRYSVSKQRGTLSESNILEFFADLKKDHSIEKPQESAKATTILAITKAKRRRRAKQNMRAVRMVTAVVVCYFAFWLLNSVCNPFIYALLDRRYSSAYARILNCKATR
ncbi:5-hydroxytryptamine receptor 6 [Clonorchis sinensis]|uniref:5-hydroxytryptamine receptor 6 n=1 Tax=Clonorchis sinensis TaxID=79923 RepID=H2KQN9_CLOSI|nr:5-hydroxytryptamine receptor 6 [Clonorchis sinensis]